MDLWTTLAIATVIELLKNKANARKAFPALAKLAVAILKLAQFEPLLNDELTKQFDKQMVERP